MYKNKVSTQISKKCMFAVEFNFINAKMVNLFLNQIINWKFMIVSIKINQIKLPIKWS